MNPSAIITVERPGRANRTFHLLAGLSILLVALIAVDGVRKGLDTIVPDYYRHFASLSIAISELAHGTSHLVGLVEVDKALEQSGYSLNPTRDRTAFLNTHPDEADAALRAAADLTISDRGKTLGLMFNETGMIDYYYVAFKLFGYHVRSIYALYVGFLGLTTLCFVVAFRQRAIFIVPSIFYLLLLLVDQHALNSADAGYGPLTNSRLLPLLSLYPALFCLALVGTGRSFRWIDAIAVALAAVGFAFVVNARTYSFWQIGPLIALVPLIVAARIVPWRWPLKAGFARLSVHPALVFLLCVATLVGIHHWRRDANVYGTSTFVGHGFWLTYAVSTMPVFRWRIPEIELQSGTTFTEGDGYGGALLRIKIKQRGQTLEDYMAGNTWDESKRDALARLVVFDLWRDYPGTMIRNYLRALTPVSARFATDLGLIALAVVAIGIGAQTPLLWLLRTVALIAIAGAQGATALAAAGLRYALPSARRLSALALPVALLALCTIPTILVMPMTAARPGAFFGMYTDPRMSDLNDAIWLCLMICVCGARLQVPETLRFWRAGARTERAVANGSKP